MHQAGKLNAGLQAELASHLFGTSIPLELDPGKDLQ